ncbi:MAG: NAD-dependent epimerase/dehydratase family protein [Candidatus Limnocylindria bacterium]
MDALIARGHEVVGIDSIDPRVHHAAPDYLNPAARYVFADVLDGPMLERELRGADGISHQAAMVGYGAGLEDAPLFARANDVGTATLLRAAARVGVRRLVLASSMVVYGDGAYSCSVHGAQRPGPRAAADLAARRFEPACPRCGARLASELTCEDAPLEPRSIYAATKVHQEHLSFVAMREGGPLVTALRYHNVYGARMSRDTPYAGVASFFRSQIASGKAARVFEDGGQRRDFVHVDRVAAANVAAIERSQPFVGPLNIGSGESHTILDLARALAGSLGAGAPHVTGEYRVGDVRHIVASSQRAEEELRLPPAIAFEAGVAAFAGAPLREAAQ